MSLQSARSNLKKPAARKYVQGLQATGIMSMPSWQA